MLLEYAQTILVALSVMTFDATVQTLFTIIRVLSLPMYTLIQCVIYVSEFVTAHVKADQSWAIAVIVACGVVSLLRDHYLYHEETSVDVFYMYMHRDLQERCKRCEASFGRVYASLKRISDALGVLMKCVPDVITIPLDLWAFLSEFLVVYVVWPISVFVWVGDVLYSLCWATWDIPYACYLCLTKQTGATSSANTTRPTSGVSDWSDPSSPFYPQFLQAEQDRIRRGPAQSVPRQARSQQAQEEPRQAQAEPQVTIIYIVECLLLAIVVSVVGQIAMNMHINRA